MRILVTGASGFIGPHLVRSLSQAGHEVFALVRDAERAPAEGTAVVADLLRLNHDDLPQVDAIVYLAQANVSLPEAVLELFGVNTLAVHELLEWARRTGIERFVHASSGSIYGLGEGPVDESSRRRANNLYAVSKRNAEQILEAYAPWLATAAVLRPFAPYGPTQQDRLIPALIRRVREGVAVTLRNGGRPRMTPIFLDDVVKAFAAALELDGHHVVNVAGDEIVSIRALAQLIGDAVGREPVFAPGPDAEGDLIADNELMHRLLGLGPLVPLAEGIRATVLAGGARLMCGIAGILDRSGTPVALEELERMSRSIAHRGPDDEGHHVTGEVGLAARRLAILDLSAAGHQPMATRDGSVTLAYNGEIYNFRELAAELEARGHRFTSRSDTEVVLRAYEEWDAACVGRFNGMFAFAIWDERRRRLVLARDRFGIKPLYYAEDNGRLLFASEVKALLEVGLGARVSPPALIEYFTFQNVFSDLTLFDGVRVLPAGHVLVASADGQELRRYWDLELEPDESVREDEWVERIRAAFEGTVARQLVSDVPVGSYLSGGMDSASIVAVATRRIPRLMTFTGGFDLSSVNGLELVFDERADAERVASAFRTEHYEMVMHSGDMWWVLPELVWHLEDLRVGMCYQNHYIARLASKFVKVALAGTGGDELFAGYPWRYELLEGAHDASEVERRLFDYWSRLVPPEQHGSFFSSSLRAAASGYDAREVFRAVVEPAAGLDPVAKALYLEAKTFLHGLLVVEDRVSMAHSLEVRVPFLDNELVALARRIPSRLKHADEGGKRLLRRAMAGLLPPAIVDKPKQGFSPPDESWYRGQSMEPIRDLLLDPRTLERGYFEPAAIRRTLDEHREGRSNHRLLIWSLLCFEWWNRLFVDGEAAARHRAWHEAARRVDVRHPA